MKNPDCRARRVVFWLLALGLLVATSFPILRAKPSQGAAVNPFDVFLQRLAIPTKPGVPTTLDRKWSTQAFPMAFMISGQLPQGSVELYALLITNNGKAYQGQPSSINPFLPRDKWTTNFFEFHQVDRLVPYEVTNLVGKTLRFSAFEKIPKTLGIKQVIIAVVPTGKVAANDLSNAHVVIVNYVK